MQHVHTRPRMPTHTRTHTYTHVHTRTQTHRPAGGDGVVEPAGVLVALGPVGFRDLVDAEDGQAVVDVTPHVYLAVGLVGVHEDQPRDHVRGEGYDERLGTSGWKQRFISGETR